jgi:hypothetical protein
VAESQPDGVGTLAAPDVHGAAGTQAADLGYQLRVGLAAPDPDRGSVPLVPGDLTEWWLPVMIVTAHLWAHRGDRRSPTPGIRT